MNAGSFSVLALALLLAASVASAQQPLPPAAVCAAGAGCGHRAESIRRLASGRSRPLPITRRFRSIRAWRSVSRSPADRRASDLHSRALRPVLSVPSTMAARRLRQLLPEAAARRLRTARWCWRRFPIRLKYIVDGYYVGLAEEFGFQGRPLNLTAGPHRVEFRGAGYETSSFNVMIDPDNILRYRGDMRLLPTGPAIVVLPQPAGPKTLYVIPKCYAGDKPPTGTLPAGCDRKNLQTYK